MMDLLSKIQKTNLADIEIKMKGTVSISFNRKTLTYSSSTMIKNCFEAASSFIRWYNESELRNELKSWSKEDLIAWLEWNDPNGVYDDEQSIKELGNVMTYEEGVEIVVSQIINK